MSVTLVFWEEEKIEEEENFKQKLFGEVKRSKAA